MANFRFLEAVAIGALLAGCSGSLPTAQRVTTPTMLLARPSISTLPLASDLKSRLAMAIGPMGFGLVQVGASSLYQMCNGQSQPQNTCGFIGATSLTGSVAGVSTYPQQCNGGEARCTLGTFVNNRSLGDLGFTLLINIAPQQSDTSATYAFNSTETQAFDTMAVNSNSLPPGSPVTLRSTVTGSAHPYCGTNYSSVEFVIHDEQSSATVQGYCSNGHLKYSPASSEAFTWTAYVGQTYVLYDFIYGLDEVYDVNSTDTALSSQFDVGLREVRGTDAIVPVTPGITLTFASGGATF